MAFPAGVETRTVRLTVPVDSLGRAPRIYAGTVKPDRSIVWEATGEPLWPVAAKLPAVVGGVVEFDVPRVDQAGWLDASGSPITGWSYSLVVRATWDVSSSTVTRRFQVVASTPDPVDVEILPAGATVPVQIGYPYTAADIEFEPTSQIAATNLQAAVEEVRAEAGGGGGASAAADVSFTPAGALQATNVQAALAELDAEKSAAIHSHVMSSITGLQAALDAKATPAEITAAINALKGSVPAAYDTLAEIAAELDSDDTAEAAILTAIGNETTARENADTALDGRVDILEAASADHETRIDDLEALPSGDGWTYERLAADFVNGTANDDPVLTGFTPAPNTTYEFECLFEVTSAVSTTGIQVGMAGPSSGITRATYKVQTPSSATTDVTAHLTALNTRATAGNTVQGMLKVEGRITVGASPGAGNIRPTARSETGLGTNVTVFAKSFMRWRALP